ncbi:MAG: hypothetical protein ACP5GZ_11340 [Vulcanisaeta sp.]|uniref:hypothetical protein n=1 Tax=Vulcanisaeta sp. TaxID=2020871 RepID=UPI003D0CC568
MASTPVSISVPIYVVGPTTLTQRLVSAGISQSLIKPVTINQLPELPNNSIVIIDWPVIKPYLIINDPGSEVKINLTSPVIRDLVLAFGGGDVVGIYANASDESDVEFILAYSWARAVGNKLVLVGNGFREVLPDYLMAYPVIPVSIHEQVIFIAKPVGPRGLVIGPIYVSQLPQFLVSAMTPIIVDPSSSSSYTDPCYSLYTQYEKYSPSNHRRGFTWRRALR